MIDERTEILINRKLDGELTEEDTLELNKLLIRNPDARALLEDCTTLDEQTSEVIEAVCCEQAERPSAAEVSTWSVRPFQRWYSLSLIGAVAAAIAFGILLSKNTANLVGQSPQQSLGTNSRLVTNAGMPADTNDPRGNEAVADAAAPQPGGLTPIARIPLDGPRHQTESLDRDVFGVWDQQSRSLYILEANKPPTSVESVKFNY